MKSILTVIALTIIPGAVLAQDDMPSAGEAMGGGSGDNVVYKKETEYDFEADDVEGNLVKPDEANIGAEQHGKTSSLIKIRSDFVPEMLKSVEDI
jgi:hypothetical protein